MNAVRQDLNVYRCARATAPGLATSTDADPVTTEIIRHALNSAAKQMKRATIRTSFSPFIYDALDFAVVLYDRQMRLIGQGATLPAFMGTMGFCIENAVNGAGGEKTLEQGDVIVYNVPYGTGSHAQDCAIVMPVFLPDGELVGYAANKAHWADIGAMAPYCTNTTDVYQEGVVIPGVKLYKAGKRNEDVYRLIRANCRFKDTVDGDINAQLASCYVGSRELLRLIERFGLDTFTASIEQMFDHGERVVREFVSKVPDGSYRATCHMDNNGIDDEPIEFEVVVTIEGSNARFDFSEAPDAQRGPINCPLPSTVSGSRVVLAMLAGNARETPNEGHFRPLEVVTRPGSMFHPLEPSPCYLYGWPLNSMVEGIFEAFAQATRGAIPSGSAADLLGIMCYGKDKETGRPFIHGCPLPVGHGALPNSDGTTVFVAMLANSTLISPELQEAKAPVLYERCQFAPNSGGAGKFRGGTGIEVQFTMLTDTALISFVERTKVPGWAQQGGRQGNPNRLEVDFADGHTETLRKVTDRALPAGSRIRLYGGGGGGYGSPADRDPVAVKRDLQSGLITTEHARKFYPHAA